MNNGGPAFPLSNPLISTGMTLRDYFAAKALVSIMGTETSIMVINEHAKKLGQPNGIQETARLSYEFADAMLAEREKGMKE